MSRIKKVIETLEAERDDVRERLAWLDDQIEAFKADEQQTASRPPARSTRRATARRASRRRHAARSLQPDVESKIVAYLEKHPQSTAGEVAKGLSLDRSDIAGRLTKMAKRGDIQKAQRGYAAAS